MKSNCKKRSKHRCHSDKKPTHFASVHGVLVDSIAVEVIHDVSVVALSGIVIGQQLIGVISMQSASMGVT